MTTELIYLLLFISAVISGSSILFLQIGSKVLKLLLAFSGAYLLAVAVLHLLPEIYSTGHTQASLFILVGFLLQILIEYFSEGIEHGHIHIHKFEEKNFPVAVMAALSVHSFIEGMPLAGELTETKKTLAAGIILHNIPIAIALLSMLLQSGQKKGPAFFWLLVFASMAPLGGIAGCLMESRMGLISHYSSYLMAMVVGIFLHVSTTILFESSEHHRFHMIKLFVILAGMAFAAVTV